VVHLDLDPSADIEREGPTDDGRQRRWVGLGGLALVVVLLGTIFLTPESPDATAGPLKVAAFARDHRGGLYLSAYLISLAVLLAGVFLWYLRELVAPGRSGRRLADLGFAGGLLFLVDGTLTAGLAFAMADVAKHASPTVLQTLNIFYGDATSYAGGATALMFGAISLGMLRSKALPSWLAYLGLVLAVGSFAVAPLGLAAFGIWVLVTSIVLLVTAKNSVVTPS
jgi:hypothetical protein